MSDLVDKAKNFVAEKVANIPKPEAAFSDVDFKKVSRQGLELLAKINVTNPYSHPLPICQISYVVKSDNREIANGNMPDPGSLKAKETTLLEIPVNVAFSILVSLARDVAVDWDIDYQLDVGLIIDLPVVGDLTIPLSTKGEFKLPTLRDMF